MKDQSCPITLITALLDEPWIKKPTSSKVKYSTRKTLNHGLYLMLLQIMIKTPRGTQI